MFLGCLAIIAGCKDDNKKMAAAPATASVETKPKLTDPFHFHKLIEVSPGEDYDVLS